MSDHTRGAKDNPSGLAAAIGGFIEGFRATREFAKDAKRSVCSIPVPKPCPVCGLYALAIIEWPAKGKKFNAGYRCDEGHTFDHMDCYPFERMQSFDALRFVDEFKARSMKYAQYLAADDGSGDDPVTAYLKKYGKSAE